MTAVVKGAIALVVVAAIGAVVYPNVKASLARSRATSRVEEAEAMQRTLTSPVAKSRLEEATKTLRLALGGTDAVGSVADADAALAETMASLKSSPPSEHPVTGDLSFDATAHAGSTFTVTANVRTELSEGFLVRVIVQMDADSGWKSGPIRQEIGQPLTGKTSVPARVQVAVPKEASGRATVQATIFYRLSATGEGREYQEVVKGTAPVTIGK